MAQTLAGLLTGVPQNAIDPNLSIQQQQLALGASAADMMGSGIRSMTGQQSQGDRAAGLQMAMSNLDLNDTEDLTKLARIMQATGDTAGAGKIAALIQDKKLKGKQREGLIKQAKGLGLDQTVDMLTSGGDVETATKQILEAEERNVIAKQGRKGKIAVAQAKGANDIVLKAISNGEYDGFSDSMFIEAMSGEKADLKVFQQVVNNKPTSKPFRINEGGQVWDNKTNKWVNPSELGLTQAPVTTQQLNAGNEVTKQLTQGFVDNFVELNALGREAEKMLEINRASALDLDKIYTGKLAPVQLALMDVGKTLGVISPEQEDAVVATQTFMINRAKQVLPLIKALGSGTAISDKDREFIEKIVAGDISLSLDTIKRVIQIENEYATKAISKSNAALDRLGTIKSADIDPAVVAGLYITAPSFSPRDEAGGISEAAQSAIDRARERALQNTGIR
jgi:hypothetical protein